MKVLNFLSRAWLILVLMFAVTALTIDRLIICDDVLNASRASVDYIHAFAYGIKPYSRQELIRGAAYYKTLLINAPFPPLMYANLGFCYYFLGKVDKAIDMYNRAIKAHTYVYTFYYDLGAIYLMRKDYENAEKNFLKSRLLIPASVRQLEEILKIPPKYFHEPMLQPGSYLFRRVSYDHQRVYSLVGAMYLELKQYEKLIALMNEALHFFPAAADLNYNAGVAHFMMGSFPSAMAFLDAAIHLEPQDNAMAYYYRSQILGKIGRWQESLTDNAKYEQLKNKVKPPKSDEAHDLHHWHDMILLFQSYR